MKLNEIFEYGIDQKSQAKEFYERAAAQTNNAAWREWSPPTVGSA